MFPDVPAFSIGCLQTALLHTLWQGAIIAALEYVMLRRLPTERINLRYTIALTGLFSLVLVLLVTCCTLERWNTPVQDIAVNTMQPYPQAAASPAIGNLSEAAPVMTAPVSPPPEESPAATRLLRIWLGGVIIMMIRMAWLLFCTRNLHRCCRPLEMPQIRVAAEEVQSALGLLRRVTVLTTDRVMTPVAMGLFWPVIVLPVSMITALSPEQLRAVLAHEFAHIRRYDYLINFFQLIVEAILYFNPAMWWLTRQVRIEREACCDVLAARVSGGALEYAAALAISARHAQGYRWRMAAAQSLGGEERHGGLLERTRRLLLPGYRPALRMRWYSFAAGALMTVALLMGLYQSSSLSVAVAGWLLNDRERIEAIAQLNESFNQTCEQEEKNREYISVSGEVVAQDGKPLPAGDKYISASSRSAHITSSAAISFDGKHFEGKVASGNILLSFEFPGYAPRRAGPLVLDSTHLIEPIVVKLEPSIPAAIRFTDPEGRPQEGVSVTAGYKYVENRWSGSIRGKSDQEGIFKFEQADPPIPLAISVTAGGFQDARQESLLIKQGETCPWVLQKDEALEGLVVDRATGRPVAGAKAVVVFQRGYGFLASTDEEPRNASSLISWLSETRKRAADAKNTDERITDANGRFVIRRLNKDMLYYILIRAKGYGAELVSTDAWRQGPACIALAPRYVRGTIRGNLNLLKPAKDGRDRVISSSMPCELPNEQHSCAGYSIDSPVTIEDGIGHFQIDDLRAGVLYIQAGPAQVCVAVNKPVEDLVIEIGELQPKRRIVFRLTPPEGAPPANGTLEISQCRNEEKSFPQPFSISVINNHAETTLIPPARLRFYVNVAGYIARPLSREERVKNLMEWNLEAGAEPFVIDIPLDRAGAIRGRVLKPGGSPAAFAHVYAAQIFPTDGAAQDEARWPEDYFCSWINNVTCDEQGAFAIFPVPLNQTFEISGSIDYARSVRKVEMTPLRPIAEVQLTLPEGKEATVRVLKPDGNPAAGIPLKIRCAAQCYTGSRTDSEGRYSLRGLDPQQDYWVAAQPESRFQHVFAKIDFEKENILQLQEGFSIQGNVLRSDTKEPISQYRIQIHAVPGAPPGTSELETYRLQFEALSDTEGKFQFTNLSPGKYSLFLYGVNGLVPENATPEATTFTAGQAEPVTILLRPTP